MKNKKLFVVFAVALFFAAIFPALAASKIKLTKAVVTEISGTIITATKNSRTYTINSERAVLKNAKNKRATLDQFLAGDQIDVNGSMGNDGIVVARTIKDRSITSTDLTRGSVGSGNLANNVISDPNFIVNGIITEDKLKAGTITNLSIADNANISASKLNLANAITGANIQNGTITSDKLADGLTLTTGNISTLSLGTNTITDGNFNGNWNFNGGNISNVGTIGSGNLTSVATSPTELLSFPSPASGWWSTVGSGWNLSGATLNKNSEGTGTIAPTSLTISSGKTYQLTVTFTSSVGTPTVTVGGCTPFALNSALTYYINTSSTDSLLTNRPIMFQNTAFYSLYLR